MKKFVAFPFEYHQELELKIDGLTSLGEGIGRVQLPPSVMANQPKPAKPMRSQRRRASKKDFDLVVESATAAVYEDEQELSALAEDNKADANADADADANAPRPWVVMVPFALPGETVRVRVYRNCRSYSQADLVEVLQPSKTRTAPVCALFTQCDGCQYQHLDYSAQLAWKTQQVAYLLERAGKLSDLPISAIIRPAVGSPKQFGYRTKITPHFQYTAEGVPEIGFRLHGTKSKIVDVPLCPIASDAINEALPAVREAAVESNERKKLEVALHKAAGRRDIRNRMTGATLLLRHANEGVVTDCKVQVTETVGDLTLAFQAGSFFQNNPHTLPLLVDHVVRHAVATKGGRQCTQLIDAYCGSGLFALSAAKYFEEVVGIETAKPSVDSAKANAAANGIKNARFIGGSAESIFAQVPFSGQDTSVVIDPPRRGCDQLFLTQLLNFRPQRIVYVSCGPDTLARDLVVLVNGGYELKHVQPFDMFPQTRHIESVAVLELNEEDVDETP